MFDDIWILPFQIKTSVLYLIRPNVLNILIQRIYPHVTCDKSSSILTSNIVIVVFMVLSLLFIFFF